eukprot:gb/GECG01008091.1/.p1 GENE.gb/GECG01008091.1/~~gb/GECG01008091.1/.p1  ORF type:complete len:1316 (+),score=169.13 gb/GECG01008091.1/:1-3948(+)
MYLSTSNLSHSVAVAPDRRHAQYAGAAAHKLDVGVVRAAYSWPTTNQSFSDDVRKVPLGIDYFEVKIDDAGQNCSITVGLVRESSPMFIQPGLSKGTFGYRSDTGNRFRGAEPTSDRSRRRFRLQRSTEADWDPDEIGNNDGEDEDSDEDLWGAGNRRSNTSSCNGEAYSETFGEGDVIGCGYISHSREVFFTKNGEHLGVAFRNVSGNLFPAVGMHSPGESVEVNLTGPFQFSLGDLYKDRAKAIEEEQRKISVKPSVVASIVQDYLLHNGYAHALFWLQESLRGNKTGCDTADHKRKPSGDTSMGSYNTPVKYDAASGGHGKVRKGHSESEETHDHVSDWWSADALSRLDPGTGSSSLLKSFPSKANSASARPPPMPPQDFNNSGSSTGLVQNTDSSAGQGLEADGSGFLGMRKRGSGNPFCSSGKQSSNSNEAQASLGTTANNDRSGIRERFGSPPGVESIDTSFSRGETNSKTPTSALADLERAQSRTTLTTNYRTPLFGPMASPATTARQYAEQSAQASQAAERIAEQRDALLSRLSKASANGHDNQPPEEYESSSSSEGLEDADAGPVQRLRSQRTMRSQATPQTRARAWSLNLPTTSPSSRHSSSVASQASSNSPFSSAFHRVFESIQNREGRPRSISRGSIPFIPASPMLTASATNVAEATGGVISENNEVFTHFKRQWSQMGEAHIPLAMGAPKHRVTLRGFTLDPGYDSCEEEDSDSALDAGSFTAYVRSTFSQSGTQRGTGVDQQQCQTEADHESSESSSSDSGEEAAVRTSVLREMRQVSTGAGAIGQTDSEKVERRKIYWSDRLLSYADVITVKQTTLPLRYECRALIMKGEIAEVMTLIESYAPFLLHCNRYRLRVTCRLLSHWCVELYREKKKAHAWDVFVNEALPLLNEAETLRGGSMKRASPSLMKALRAIALMLNSGDSGITDTSTTEFLLSNRARDVVADEVNNALLDYGLLLRGKQRIASIEQQEKSRQSSNMSKPTRQSGEEEPTEQNQNGNSGGSRSGEQSASRRRRSHPGSHAEQRDSFSQMFQSLSQFALLQRLFGSSETSQALTAEEHERSGGSTREQSQQTGIAQESGSEQVTRRTSGDTTDSTEEEIVFPSLQPENTRSAEDRRGRLSNILMRSLVSGFSRGARESEEEGASGSSARLTGARSALMRSVRARTIRRRRRSSDSEASSEIPSINISPRPAILGDTTSQSDTEMEERRPASAGPVDTSENQTTGDSTLVREQTSPSPFKLDSNFGDRNSNGRGEKNYGQLIPDRQFRSSTPPCSTLERITRQLLACKAMLAHELPSELPI